ncbi:MAG: hypothetical protein AABY98_00945 [Candidatus Deferrimicrobiota bacterium]
MVIYEDRFDATRLWWGFTYYGKSGVRSTQGLFALYLSGWPLEKLHNYDSSWIGWSKDDRLPLEAGLPTEGTLEHAKR